MTLFTPVPSTSFWCEMCISMGKTPVRPFAHHFCGSLTSCCLPYYLTLTFHPRFPCKSGGEKRRADEWTRTADLISLRVIGQVSQGCARVCKFGIYKPICLPRIALCCTVLRSRWYQSGIRTSDRYSLTSSRMARTRALRSHNPPIPVSRRCRMLQNRLI